MSFGFIISFMALLPPYERSGGEHISIFYEKTSPILTNP